MLQRKIEGRLFSKEEILDTTDMQQVKAIEITENKKMCFRCGNNVEDLFFQSPCSRCDSEECWYCRNCIIMGKMTECSNLFFLPSMTSIPHQRSTYLAWKGELSPGQSVASKKVHQAVVEKEDLLLWAVAGSGKTEMMFEGMNEVLIKGGRLCVASPRVDVCLELFPRLQEVFPDVAMVCLYGDSTDVYDGERFVVATTHQLVRFYEAFDVVFIDEVDAFPYAKDPFLEYAVKKAQLLTGCSIFITATPDRKWQIECDNGKRNFVKVPARYHRKSLPVPQKIWIGEWKKGIQKQKIPSKILRWMRQKLDEGCPVLLFFPEIKVMLEVAVILEQLDFEPLLTVHSADPERKEKVQQMRDGTIKLLLTTTILERGVTFTNVQVGVFGSEGRIFTESALVQISGRAGRKFDYPRGDVLFFHNGVSKNMALAISQIKMMNQLGIRQGLLDEK
ncbi:DEAD/DEAH box helicase [Listeria rustica]|uniref:DEAD/DEAH box helicase n=1 Tax=Listeria rustica TaxID=2713503 RepID=A0A7W1T8D4_9LIST|nr:DEAD/DEAH box helicase [Listeria rustica]MBA3927327.1 DEAD/DEAH box helicase [Listeria rustica]